MDVGQKYAAKVDFPNPGIVVSILVLMDVGQKLSVFLILIIESPSFNPCFNGCRSEIEMWKDISIYGGEFQSLF